MRILVLSWRDPANPLSGGAEAVTVELARAWQRMGHQVTWFASAFPGGAPEETVGGIAVIRAGRPWTVHWQAFRAYRHGRLRGYDLVIDQIHGLGFLTPLYVRERRVAFIHEVAGRIWFAMWPFPAAVAGWLLERLSFLLYRRTPFVVPSPSTRDDLVRAGIPRERITVLRWGPDFARPPQLPPKEAALTVISVGRLCRMKRPAHLLKAFAIVREQCPEARLWLVGRGPEGELRRLEWLVHRLGLDGAVTFTGFVSEETKRDRIARAWVLASASLKEGWGLIVEEANLLGTPVAVSDVPGLRDAVREGWGVVSRRDHEHGLADAILEAAFSPAPATGIVGGGERYAAAATALLAAAGVDGRAAEPDGRLGQENALQTPGRGGER